MPEELTYAVKVMINHWLGLDIRQIEHYYRSKAEHLRTKRGAWQEPPDYVYNETLRVIRNAFDHSYSYADSFKTSAAIPFGPSANYVIQQELSGIFHVNFKLLCMLHIFNSVRDSAKIDSADVSEQLLNEVKDYAFQKTIEIFKALFKDKLLVHDLEQDLNFLIRVPEALESMRP